jgi:drug/metabolite transporter (DMT)-like permease
MSVYFSHLYIMISDEVLKSDLTLFIFLSIVALLGWISPYIAKTLVKKYSPFTLSIIDAIVVVITLLVVALFVEKERMGKVISDMRNMAPHEYAQLILLGVVGAGVGLAGTAIIRHHNIGKFQLHDYIVTILVSAIGVYIFMRDELTLQKVVGLIVIALGGYVFSN